MAVIDNTLAAKIETFDPATPLAQAAKIQGMQAEAQAAQFKQKQIELGSEVRGLQPYVNTPEFPAKWAETADRLHQRGLLDAQSHQQWRNTPSPLLLKSLVAQTSDPTLDFRKQEAQRAQGNADREFGLKERTLNATIDGSKIPPGFTRQPDGSLAPVKGGPTDPEYIKTTNEAKAKPKEFSYTDTSKLADEGGKFTSVNRFVDNFKDSYGGALPGTGDAQNWLRRTLPDGMITQEAREAGTYWQEYDRYKNVVRNDLFGSALTATEKSAFERADINNSMSPAAIKANLKVQKDILEGAMKRKANSLIASGYNPQAISQAYGVPLEQLGVEQQGKSRTGSGGEKKATAVSPALESAKAAIAKGAPRDAVIKRLRDNGIDPGDL